MRRRPAGAGLIDLLHRQLQCDSLRPAQDGDIHRIADRMTPEEVSDEFTLRGAVRLAVHFHQHVALEKSRLRGGRVLAVFADVFADESH